MAMLRNLRNWLVAGMVVLLPVWLTFFTVTWLFTNVDSAVAAPLERYLPISLPGVGVLLALLLTLLAGWLTTHFLGQKLLEMAQQGLLRIPVVKAIYSALKQVTDAVFNSKEQAFSQVVLVEFPRRELYSLGFVAGDLPGTDLVRVWLAPGPSPSAGPVLLIPRDDLVVLPMRVEDGLKLILSAGVLTPKESDVNGLAEAVAELRRRHEIG